MRRAIAKAAVSSGSPMAEKLTGVEKDRVPDGEYGLFSWYNQSERINPFPTMAMERIRGGSKLPPHEEEI